MIVKWVGDHVVPTPKVELDAVNVILLGDVSEYLQAMGEDFRDSGVEVANVLAVGFADSPVRMSPAEIGTVTSVELVSLNAVNLDRSRITWRENIESSGRQALALGIYAETLNAWLGTYKNLSARTGIPISTKKGLHGEDSLIRIPQVITVTGELESGALITELHSGLVTDKSTLSDRLTVWGLKGTLRYNFSNQVLEYAGADSTLEPVAVPAQFLHPWTVELDFIEAIKQARQGQTWKVSPDFTEGLLYMKKVEAVYLSVESGRNIDVAGL